jgi:hypothetical protein
MSYKQDVPCSSFCTWCLPNQIFIATNKHLNLHPCINFYFIFIAAQVPTKSIKVYKAGIPPATLQISIKLHVIELIRNISKCNTIASVPFSHSIATSPYQCCTIQFPETYSTVIILPMLSQCWIISRLHFQPKKCALWCFNLKRNWVYKQSHSLIYLDTGLGTILLLLYCTILKHQYNILQYSPP